MFLCECIRQRALTLSRLRIREPTHRYARRTSSSVTALRAAPGPAPAPALRPSTAQASASVMDNGCRCSSSRQAAKSALKEARGGGGHEHDSKEHPLYGFLVMIREGGLRRDWGWFPSGGGPHTS